jgi:Bacterial lectin
MFSPKIFAVCPLVLVVALCCGPAVAQITYSNFSSTAGLQLNGTASQATNGNGQQVLRLTPDLGGQDGSAWYTTQQSVANGFTTVFQFQITHNPATYGPADGIAFVVQNSASFECGPLCALGGGGGGIGYDGIDNSLAVEFDTYQNSYDPNANHVAVQSCGTANNTADHTTSCKLGIAPMPGVSLADGNVHTAVLQYDPGGEGPGTLSIFIDNVGMPVLTVPLQLDTLLNLNFPEDGTQTAYVGFTGATGAASENNDILTWTFTPGGTTAPTPITQTLTPGPGIHTTNYVFGSYNHKYQYSNAQAGDQVTVTAIPSDPAAVNLCIQGSFPTANCIPYEGTGAECVVFQVTCAASTGSDCTNLPYTLYDSYNTSQTIAGPCLLKTESYPSGPWVDIESAFFQTRVDPTHTGNSNGFSYFVAAQNCAPAALPASALNGRNCNGVYTGTYTGNLAVSNGQSCTFTNGGVTGNLTQTGGAVVLLNTSFVNGNLQMKGGNLSISNTTVGGDLHINRGGPFSIGPAVSIGGSLQIQNLPASAGTTDQVCGVSVKGNLVLLNSGTATQIGTGCGGNSVGGDLGVKNNTAPTQIYFNMVGGNLTDQNNTALTQIYSNTVNGNLTDQNNTAGSQVFSNVVTKKLRCQGDTGITGGGNTAGSKLGQCASF